VAFVNGQQSAERFSLDKELSELRYEPAGEGLYEIAAIDHDGVEVISEDNITIDRVEELVGKEMAEKIANGEGEKGTEGGYRDWRSFSGDGLKIEAKGMRAFYDQIVPSVLKDVLRKVGGGTVGEVAVQGESKYEKQFKSEAAAEAWAEENLGDHAYRVYGASSASQTFAIYDEFTNRPVPDVAKLTQPGFDITPAMRERAADGLPLFDRTSDQLRRAGTGEQAMDTARVQRIVAPLVAKWDVDVRVVATPADLPVSAPSVSRTGRTCND
jgi:hypothetical protein